jgi:rfaE bifunctional protein nucleotidyltransferase chain/domain/rfaE bifunctional protein kinase chain/domain
VERETIANLADRWSGRRVLVLGDALLDGWLTGTPDRLCREAPVSVVELSDSRYAPGGAANTATNLAALGARVELVAATGGDETAHLLSQRLSDGGVSSRLIPVEGRRTVTKRRLVAGEQIVARFDEGDIGPLPPGPAEALLREVSDALDDGPEAVIVCDYAAGTLPDGLIDLLDRRRDRIRLLAVDAHDLRRWARTRPDLVTPNIDEAARLLGVRAPVRSRIDWATEQLPAIREAAGAGIAALTLDVDGSLILDGSGALYRTATNPGPAAHSAGAGDSYLAGFVLAALAGAGPAVASQIAQGAAGSALAEPGTTVCGVDVLLDWMAPEPPRPLDVTELTRMVGEARALGARIVFTNGCFDVLHRGHIGYLVQARQLGEVLIVAVNSDESVRRLKGPGRPVNPQEDRAGVLAALGCVDHVIIFDDDSPTELLEAIRPDVYVKGGDYTPELIPEAELVYALGGEVQTLAYLPDRSTSAIIERIRSREAAPVGVSAAGSSTASGPDGGAPDGAARDGAARDGGAREGGAPGGAAQDNAARDVAAPDGAAQDGGVPVAAAEPAGGARSVSRAEPAGSGGGHQ